MLANCAHEIVLRPKERPGCGLPKFAVAAWATGQVNPQTFESLLRPNLYIVGEMLDVAGQLGGYNLHWAFCLGVTALAGPSQMTTKSPDYKQEAHGRPCVIENKQAASEDGTTPFGK